MLHKEITLIRKTTNRNKKIFTLKEVSKILGVSIKKIRYWIMEGELDSIKLDERSTRVTRRQLQAFILIRNLRDLFPKRIHFQRFFEVKEINKLLLDLEFNDVDVDCLTLDGRLRTTPDNKYAVSGKVLECYEKKYILCFLIKCLRTGGFLLAGKVSLQILIESGLVTKCEASEVLEILDFEKEKTLR